MGTFAKKTIQFLLLCSPVVGFWVIVSIPYQSISRGAGWGLLGLGFICLGFSLICIVISAYLLIKHRDRGIWLVPLILNVIPFYKSFF